jgi:hypothetical protein
MESRSLLPLPPEEAPTSPLYWIPTAAKRLAHIVTFTGGTQLRYVRLPASSPITTTLHIFYWLFCLNVGNWIWVVKIDIDTCRLTCQVFCQQIRLDRRYSRVTIKILICLKYDILVLFDSNSCINSLLDYIFAACMLALSYCSRRPIPLNQAWKSSGCYCHVAHLPVLMCLFVGSYSWFVRQIPYIEEDTICLVPLFPAICAT